MTSHDLSHVYWIGGASCAGKGTISQALVERFGRRLYDCDEAFEVHEKTVSPEQFPVLHRLSRLSWNDLWMRPVDQQVREELELYYEEWSLILDDLRQLPADRPILAEGNALLPELFDGSGISPARMIWIVPTPEFQRENYARREWVTDILAECDDPEQAWRNWMDRDAGFAAHVMEQARIRGRTIITVDGSEPVETILARVVSQFGLDTDWALGVDRS
jgi:2-phosphoglycerate kinase